MGVAALSSFPVPATSSEENVISLWILHHQKEELNICEMTRDISLLLELQNQVNDWGVSYRNYCICSKISNVKRLPQIPSLPTFFFMNIFHIEALVSWKVSTISLFLILSTCQIKKDQWFWLVWNLIWHFLALFLWGSPFQCWCTYLDLSSQSSLNCCTWETNTCQPVQSIHLTCFHSKSSSSRDQSVRWYVTQQDVMRCGRF